MTLVREGIAFWQSCINYAKGFPAITDRAPASRLVQVELRRSSSTNRCGSFRGRTITLYVYATQTNGTRVRCPSPARNLAHEIGHVLGLADAPSAPLCKERIMSVLRDGNGERRAVGNDECQAAGHRWLTPQENEEWEALRASLDQRFRSSSRIARGHSVRWQGAPTQAYWESVEEVQRCQRAEGAEIGGANFGNAGLERGTAPWQTASGSELRP